MGPSFISASSYIFKSIIYPYYFLSSSFLIQRLRTNTCFNGGLSFLLESKPECLPIFPPTTPGSEPTCYTWLRLALRLKRVPPTSDCCRHSECSSRASWSAWRGWAPSNTRPDPVSTRVLRLILPCLQSALGLAQSSLTHSPVTRNNSNKYICS